MANIQGKPENTDINEENITKTAKTLATKDSQAKSIKEYSSKERQNIIRENVTQVLEKSTLMPFRWLKTSYRCFFCYEIFQEPKDLKAHQENHKPEEIKKKMNVYLDNAVNVDVSRISCKLCSEKVEDLYVLIDHLIIKHGLVFNKDVGICMNPFKLNDITVTCVVCEGTFQTFGRLLVHTNKYHKGFARMLCDICGAHFKSTTSLRDHVNKVHAHKTVKCNLCDDRMQPTTLRTHMQKVHGRRYKCSHCTDVFETHYKRSHHMMTVHKNREEIKCPQCPLTFVFRSKMMRHVREIHLHEKNAVCGVCGWQSFEVCRLQRHMMKHSDVRNFNCSICGKSFKIKKTMMEHYNNIHLKRKRKNERPRQTVPP